LYNAWSGSTFVFPRAKIVFALDPRGKKLFLLKLITNLLYISTLKGSDDVVLHLKESCFGLYISSNVFIKNNVSETGPEDGNKSSFRNVVFLKKTSDDGQSPKT
jgi:hypothetical protein